MNKHLWMNQYLTTNTYSINEGKLTFSFKVFHNFKLFLIQFRMMNNKKISFKKKKK